MENKANTIPHMDALIEAIDFNGWTIHADEHGWEICQHSPAGEDYSFFVSADGERTPQRLARGIQEAARDFDVDEHIGLWVEASLTGTCGVPNVRTLVHDAENIQQMMESLAEVVEGWC